MAKRVVTKVGFIYGTAAGRLLQLVALDLIALNSDVIVVYKQVEGATFMDVPNLPIDFYHHSIVSVGIKQGLWRKLGKGPIPDVSKLVFKQYFGKEELELEKFERPEFAGQYWRPPIPFPNWTTWTPIDEDWTYVTERRGLTIRGEDGAILPADDILYRIEHGVSKFKLEWPDAQKFD